MPEESNDRLTKTVRLNNLAAQIMNPLVNQVYYRGTEADNVLRDTLLIEKGDSAVAIGNKLLIFFLGCNKLSTEVEERVIVSKAIEAKSLERAIVEVKLKCGKRYYRDENGVSRQTGYAHFRIPNLSLDYIGKNPNYFSELTYRKGSQKAIYTLTDGSQLKVFAWDKEEADRHIDYLLKAVEPDKKYGSSAKHSSYTDIPLDIEKSPTHGETFTCYKAVFIDPITGKKVGSKLY